ncbi:hypothetical protein [Candidatus Mycobacterium methanotrophicum]|uniref:AMP-dependent synthetase/ligase domain-containing protein n=1 Tax=Candidatus Mycobacterium methanotrophicum TaxID=2943498 RepID=A0ABY4QFG7_9MYCO|nr:hypothetical protein [Candidatus Mycobacterium methanotrophicum]UQX09673.1 hypothetical protein M5I08_15195 [Candidatus Mycobacterium methanotrophicum]
MAICAPQGFEYVVGFLGVVEAGFVAVPLSAPRFGAHDERLSAALRDNSPAAILTPSAVVNDVVSCARALPLPLPAVIEIDALDLDTPADLLHQHGADQNSSATIRFGFDSSADRRREYLREMSSNAVRPFRGQRVRFHRRIPRSSRGRPSITTWACCSELSVQCWISPIKENPD